MKSSLFLARTLAALFLAVPMVPMVNATHSGTVVAWGDNGFGQTTVPAGLSGVTAIAAGVSHTVALKNDGTVVAWGDNGDGQTTVPAGLSGVTAIAAGGRQTVAILGTASVIGPTITITTQPASRTVNAGQNTTFSVTATGTGPLTFQWRNNGTNIPIATNSVLNVFFTGTNQSGNYSVVVSNSGGSVTSTSALLTVIPSGTYFASLVQGVAQITLPGIPGAVAPLSLDWVPIATGDADTPDPSTFAMARMYGFGRVLMLGHNGLLSNPTLLNNQQFMLNTIAWLDSFGSKRVAYTSAHGEALNSGNLSSLANILTNRGYTFGPLANPLTAASLRSVGVLIVGNAWGSFTSAEIDAVRAYVAAGGGVALVGLGWSWIAYHPTTTMNDYPMAKMAQPFGATWLDNYISDPTDQLDGSTIFNTFYPNTDFGPTPSLEATVVSNSIALAWPASVPGFVLETSTSLTSPWSAVTSVTNIVRVKWNVSQPTLEGRRFYRLRRSGP